MVIDKVVKKVLFTEEQILKECDRLAKEISNDMLIANLF